MWRWRTPTTHPLPASVLFCGSLTQCRLGSSAMSRRATCDPRLIIRFVRSEFRLMRIPCEHASCTPGTPYPQSAVARNRRGNTLQPGDARGRGERILEAAPSARRSRPKGQPPSPVLALGRTKIRRRGSTWRGAVLVAPLGAAQAHAGPSRASVARAAASSSMRSLSSLAAA